MPRTKYFTDCVNDGDEDKAIAQCKILKNKLIDLPVQVLFFNDHTLAWVIQSVESIQ